MGARHGNTEANHTDLLSGCGWTCEFAVQALSNLWDLFSEPPSHYSMYPLLPVIFVLCVVRLCMLWSKMGIREFIQAFIIFQWVLYSFNASCKGGETRHNIWFKYILFTRGVRCPHFSLASGDYNLVTSMFLLTVIEVTAALSKLWNFLSYEEISFGPSWRTKNVIERLNFHIVTSLDS